uniref:Uncharacterized protein n=1 Tax=Anguilla anguilla TaxID=7936 RepID=A0A0E9WKY8_ANGAN
MQPPLVQTSLPQVQFASASKTANLCHVQNFKCIAASVKYYF